MDTNHRLHRRQRSTLAEMSDEDLMEQFQDGTLEAFNLLVQRYSNRLTSYLYGFVGDAETCKDLLQETFVRVYRNRFSYMRIARFSTWLYTIAGNLARSEYRKRKRRKTYSLNQVSRHNEEYDLDVEDDGLRPDRHAEATLQARSVQRALMRLSEEFREIIVLRDVQQLSYEEIAEITGLPMGTVKSRIHRSRVKLQSYLRDVYAPVAA